MQMKVKTMNKEKTISMALQGAYVLRGIDHGSCAGKPDGLKKIPLNTLDGGSSTDLV